MKALPAAWLSRWLLGEGRYGRAHLKVDVIAGLTVALVLIPQSMAYAQLAGLPFYYGLYAAFLPPAVAALLGSSRQLATGPVAVVSLMTAAALEPLATAGSETFVAAAILLSLLVGGIQLAVGLLRLGVLVNLLSHPVINGFTNAAALIIATSQLGKLLGVTVSREGSFFTVLGHTLAAALSQLHWPTFLMGLLAFGIMMGLRRLAPRSPNILVAVVITTLLSWMTGFSDQRSVPAEAIQHPPFHHALARHKEAHGALARAAQGRSRLMTRLNGSAAASTPEACIDLERDLALARLEEARAAAEFDTQVARLKAFDLVRTSPSAGVEHFHEADHLPEAVSVEPALWHLVVGKGPLDEAHLRLQRGGAVVGDIPRGLPAIGLPDLGLDQVLTLLPYALIIALLGFMEAISIAKAMAAKTGQRIEPNRELVGQGIGNLVGAVSASFPCAGSFSRSAVNLQAGAQSSVASVVTSLAVMLTLLFFTPLLYHLPQSVLAAVIMMAVAGLINIRGFMHTWRAQWFDGAISVISFGATLFFAPHLDWGIFHRRGTLSVGVSAAQHAAQGGGSLPGGGSRPARPRGQRAGRVPLHRRGEVRRSPLLRQRQLSGGADPPTSAPEKGAQAHHRRRGHQRYRCLR
jgi:MFS superfamily sulfate permease-like transporter